jgi:hypothetical protein
MCAIYAFGFQARQAVTDRHNGASNDRHIGSTFRCGLGPFERGFKSCILPVFESFLNCYFGADFWCPVGLAIQEQTIRVVPQPI